MRRSLSFAILALTLVGPAAAAPPATAVSAPISHIRYDVTFDSTTAMTHSIKVAMTFDVVGPAPVILSLPAWTPGAYEITWFARWVSSFAAEGGGQPLTWDKVDYDTWRVRPGTARTVKVSFDFKADSLDNAMAWSRRDFAFFNGTNLFLYPEGRGFDFPASVRIQTQSGWQVATGMHPAAEGGAYAERNYHDLVDMPFFVGRLDLDSLNVAGKWVRLATYPAGTLAGEARAATWHDIERMIPVESGVFQATPWDNYTTMMVFDSTYPGYSALEHQSSHLGIYVPAGIGQPLLSSITAHEMFHSWNVKRLRPSEMVPYRYDQPEPTPWLWVSEGITDYYADLTLVRGGIVDLDAFLQTTSGKITQVAEAPPVALEDASLSTWVHPEDGTGYLYYPKGSLAGLMLDILIRDASDNHASLDQVMRTLYQTTYQRGRGFTGPEWWSAVSRAAGGKSFTDFNARYVDGREPFPWDSVLPLAGLRLTTQTIREPRMGLNAEPDTAGGVRAIDVVPGSMFAEAGVEPGDLVISVGGVPTAGNDFGAAYRQRYAQSEGMEVPIVLRRGTENLTLTGKVKMIERRETSVTLDPNASPKALRIRAGITTGK